MAPICARNCATRSCCCCATRPVAARASSRGKSPSTSAPAPIAAIICNHSRRVLLVTLRLTVHPPLEVRCNMSRGESRARVRLRQDQAFVLEHWSSPPVLFLHALVLTPCPPLPSGEGERCAISERPAQQRCQVVACHIAVRDADHSIACGLQDCRTRGIMRLSFAPRVRRALKLEHQPLGGAVEVNDEPMEHVLAPKLEAEDAPLPQQRPCISLSGRCRASQLARLRKLPAGRDTPEWIHKSHARAASSDHQTETPRQRACCCGMRMCSREVAQGSPSPEGSPHPPDPLSLRERGGLRYLCSGDILHRNSRRQVDREPERDEQDAARGVANDGCDGGGRAGRRALSPRAGPRGDRPGRTTAAGSRGAVPSADRRHSDKIGRAHV